MAHQTGIVSPLKNEHTPDLGPLAVMVSSRGDLISCCNDMGLEASVFQPMFISRLYRGTNERGERFSLVGPFIGAPYAVMMLETLIAWGAKSIIVFGWCGAVSHDVKIGDIIVPSAAMIDEGTSGHYQESPEAAVRPSPELSANVKKCLKRAGVNFHEGVVWSTDGVFRETPEKVKHFQRKGVSAVEMELSALFTVAGYHQVDAAGILAVSDEVSSLSWHTGFQRSEFKHCRDIISKVVAGLLGKTLTEPLQR